MTADKKPKSDARFVTKAVRDEHPDLYPKLARARDRLHQLCCELLALSTVEATIALARLSLTVAQHYAERKARSAALDYEDLIEHTANLLQRSEMADWVLYKLDNGLDHILVDEAQDTSPAQWQVIGALANEFFAGDNGGDRVRTLFAVGDEKQSIYSFQGAAPHMFAATGARFADAATAADRAWSASRCGFRFAPSNRSCSRSIRHSPTPPALPASGRAKTAPGILHTAWGMPGWWRSGRPRCRDTRPSPPWSPLDEERQRAPAIRLAERIADLIKSWLDNREQLASAARPVRAGDIVILVRKRQPFAGPMVAALKARGIPVAGADRLRLTDELAVKDLVALADFLVLPEDDLALACVLKSPLFDLTDDDLIAIAPLRKGGLWSALLEAAKTSPRFAPAAETLKRWRHDANLKPPFEFFAEVLDRTGGRERLLTRLGPDAADRSPNS